MTVKAMAAGFAALLLAGGAVLAQGQGQRPTTPQAQPQPQARPAALDDDALHQQARQFFEPIPSMVPSVQGNPVTREKVELGRMLFFDPRLSASGVLSCNSCHNLAMGGADNVETSIGHGWQRGSRNSPTVLNAVFNVAQFWDGRAADLRSQATGPIQASVEMAATPQFVMAVLTSIPEYRDRFTRAFPGESQALSFDNLARAIEAFEATLITPNSRFDQYLEGNRNILTAQERQGLELFISTGCVACHAGRNLGGQDYYPFGVVERPGAEILPPEDRGRFQVTRTATDEYVFRAVPLRNVALTMPYFHSGKVWDLRQAVAVMGVAQLGAQLNPAEVDAITAFLHTLTGEQPRVELPVLPASTAETPRPSPGAMPQSQQQTPGPQR
ncbi:cytochrome-c peroxidase [Falsiroseomonas sp. CW058]|uniref:cytochrome-c peroxidase n=1 Tax=Falsiroseomonas sp. CW058 TaxID=3388664 RepID=UPI003D316316